MQMQNGGLGPRGPMYGGQDLQQAALNEAMMEQLQYQDRQERLDAHIQRRARQTAEAVLGGKTPAEAAATPAAGKVAALQMPTPIPLAMPRPAYYGPMMPQMGFGCPQVGYGYGYQTPLQQQIQRNNPYNGIMI